MQQEPVSSNPERRSFMKKAAAAVIGAVAALVPMGAGVAVLLDPLRRKRDDSDFVRVTSLDALPADGTPQRFPIIKEVADAWNRYPPLPVGAVYLRRTGPEEILALNVSCPHAGCSIQFKPGDQFLCPCHDSAFTLAGEIATPSSPSRRPMDSLPVEIRNENEVWVRFQNFQAGIAEKIPA